MVILITGRANAGKTHYGAQLAKELILEGLNVSMIDGDTHRDKTNNKDFTDKGRIDNLTSAADLAAELEEHADVVIVAFVAPRQEWRDMMRKKWKKSRVVYVPGGTLWEGTTYEKPTDEELETR